MTDDTEQSTLTEDELIERLQQEAPVESSMDFDEHVEVTHVNSGARVRMNMKRGTGTRDQDEVTGELKAASIGELAGRLPNFRAMLVHQMEDLRSVQPDEEGDDA